MRFIRILEWPHAACTSKDDVDTIPTKPGWQLTTHEPEDSLDENEAWQNLQLERPDFVLDEAEGSVEAILCRMSRWLPIENTGC